MITHLPVFPAFETNNLGITMQSSDAFAPYASVLILSIIEHTSEEYNYDILVTSWDMKEDTAEKLTSMVAGYQNVSLRVVDIANEIKELQALWMKREDYERFGSTGVVRLMLPELLGNYDIVLNFDCDMLALADVAEVFQYDLSDYYYGGVTDVICYCANRRREEKQFTDQHIFETLRLNRVSDYINAGLLYLNLKMIRDHFSTEDILQYAKNDGKFFICLEQDAFNGLFKEKKLKLPAVWNWLIDTSNVITRGKQILPANDEVLEAYYSAEGSAKIIHYVTRTKPWNTASFTHAAEWWDAARRSAFFEFILNGADARRVSGISAYNILGNQLSSKNKRYLLFYCDTMYQLLNAINIKYYYYPNTATDIVLTALSNLPDYYERVLHSGLFQNVILSDFDNSHHAEIMNMSNVQRTAHPEQNKYAISLKENYTDYFFPVPGGVYPKMIYYQMVNAGLSPSVHIFEEGWTTYTENLVVKLSRDLQHEMYPKEERIGENVANIFLYRPELYSGPSNVPKIMIPQINSADEKYLHLLRHIFGECELPAEKYIFFNENFAEVKLASNDIQILDEISRLVGKKNIAVKMHPLSTHSRELYEVHGFHVLPDDSIPWEMYVLSPEIDKKVLIAISSNTMTAHYTVCGKAVYSISLLDIMKLSRRWNAGIPEYRSYMRKLQAAENTRKVVYFTPHSMSELESVIQYIERTN